MGGQIMAEYYQFAHSVQGYNHIKANKVCQDASGECHFEDVSIIAVADGHGSNNYIRTDRGSKFAVSAALTAIKAFVQDNESFSTYGVLRGLHFQKPPFTQSKLVRVIKGAVLDVAVDIRKGSPTFGKHVAVELTGENHRQFFIPRGFAHGFAVLSDEVLFQYKCDHYYAPQSEGGIAWDDPDLGIDWRLPADKVILSDKDKKHPRLKDYQTDFDFNQSLY